VTTNATYAHDLAISAVSFDALLVKELIAALAPRLQSAPVWDNASAPSALSADLSRVALVLAQRLWGRGDEEATTADAEVLRERARRKPKSVIVVALDDEELPSWMNELRQCEFAVVGVDGAAQFVLEAIAGTGGSVRGLRLPEPTADATEPLRWQQSPVPFLGQPRAQGALRRELDSIGDELEPMFEGGVAQASEGIFELHKQPNRIVARLAGVGVSFSWVAGRQGTVADGRLMVIEWSGVAARRGVGALGTARPVRECLYSAEARGVDDWCWRADVPNGRASSTANLVREWLACASMTARTLAVGSEGA
jgi:hypothetical protein